jgi:hypothetical protein
MADLVTRIGDVITAIGTAIKGKQDNLVNQTNIKSINNISLLGGGDIAISGTINIQTKKMTETQQSTSTTMNNITALSGATLAANSTYQVDCFVTFKSAATTNGLGLGYVIPTGAIAMVEIVVPITSTAVASQLRTIFPNAAATTTGEVLGTGVTAINSNHTARISGIIKTGATAGTLAIRFRTEVASSAITLQAGSELHLMKVA